MKRSIILFWAVTFTWVMIGCRTTPQKPQIVEYSIEEFLKTVNFHGTSFSPDKSKILVSSDQSGIYNVYAIPVKGGEPIAMTRSTKESIFSRGYFPADERILYSSDEGGNELSHIYVRELDGTVKDITPGEKVKARFYGWAKDGLSFYIATNERDQRFYDLYEYRTDGYEREMVFQNDDAYDIGDISADKKYVSLRLGKTNANSDIFLYDRQTKKIKHITPHEGDVNFSPVTFNPSSTHLYFKTNENHEFTYLMRLNLADFSKEEVLKPNWDVFDAVFSFNGKYFVVTINNDSKIELKVFDSAMNPVALPDLADLNITLVDFTRDESMMAFYASSGRTPRNLYVHDFSGKQPVKLTRSLNPAINADHLVAGKVVRFKSFDGLEIPGVLYKPHQASPENKLPALVWVHGGPGGQSRIGYRADIQYLVNHGYVVFAINNRGSSGYGKTFYHLDDQKHGEGDLDDCVSSKKMLIETGYVDPEKIGIIGGSYGGYMTLAALTFRPEAFACGVDLFGISNWVRTLRSIPPYWESYRKALEKEMGPFDDEEYLRSISPLFHSEKITKPLMVLQGANDPRVIKAESDEIVEAVKKNGVPVEYIVFEDEGHGFYKKENQIKSNEDILKFLDKYLKGEKPE